MGPLDIDAARARVGVSADASEPFLDALFALQGAVGRAIWRMQDDPPA